MPGELVVDAGSDAISRVGAAVEVLGVQSLALGMGNEIVEQQLEFFRREPAVLLPPDALLSLGVDDDEFVFGAAAGMGAGLGAERPALDDEAFAVGNRMFDQGAVGQIPVDRCEVFQAELSGAMRAIPQTGFLHSRLRNSIRAPT